MALERLMSVKDARSYLGIGLTKLYAEVKAGKLQLRKAGRRTVILESEIARYQASLPAIGREGFSK